MRKVRRLLRKAGIKAIKCSKSCEQAMVRRLTFEQWAAILKGTPPKSRLRRKVALNAMINLAASPDDWMVVFCASSVNPKLLKKIKEVEGFQNWHNIFQNATDLKIKKIALNRMDAECRSADQRCDLFVALHEYRQEKVLQA